MDFSCSDLTGVKFEQYFSVSTRSQRMLERFLELLERIHMLDCGGERSISYQVAQLLVNLLDFCAGCVAYPIDEPESVQAKTTVDKVFGGNDREMPALQGINNNRAAGLERLGQFPDGSSAHRIEDKTKPLPVESPLDVLLQVVALVDYTVASKLADLFGSLFPADDVRRFDSCELRQLNDVLSHGRIGCSLTDPVTGHQRNISVEQQIGSSWIDPNHRELQRIRLVAHRHDVAHRDNNLVRPRTLLVSRQNQDSLTLQSTINLRARLGDSANTLRTDRGWEGRPDAIHPTDEHKVRWIERGRFHRDENILLAKSRFGDRVEFDNIRRFAVS